MRWDSQSTILSFSIRRMRVKSDIDHEICFEREPSGDEASMSPKANATVLLDTRHGVAVHGTLMPKLRSLVGPKGKPLYSQKVDPTAGG
jgi:hypothetical protein